MLSFVTSKDYTFDNYKNVIHVYIIINIAYIKSHMAECEKFVALPVCATAVKMQRKKSKHLRTGIISGVDNDNDGMMMMLVSECE